MQIGFIGLGNMGAPMAKNLAAAGHSVTGFDTAPVTVEGVAPAASAAEAARGREAVVTMLPNGEILRRVYAEIGSTFATTLLLGGPTAAADLIGQLLKTLGSQNILWGTDSIWWGSPQFAIDAFKNLEIPESMQEERGYPALTEKRKERILGLNAAKLYGVKPRAELCKVPADRIAQMQTALGGFRADRSLRTYGPRTRREFLALQQLDERRG